MGVFRNCVCPLDGVITWHRAVECLVSVANCVIYILPFLLSYKYADIVVSCCDKRNVYVSICWWPIGRPPSPSRAREVHTYGPTYDQRDGTDVCLPVQVPSLTPVHSPVFGSHAREQQGRPGGAEGGGGGQPAQPERGRPRHVT